MDTNDRQIGIENNMDWTNDIGGNYLKVEAGKQYVVEMWEKPILEPSPFKDKNGMAKPDRRTYTFVHEGRTVKYSPGSTFEKQLKAAILTAKITRMPFTIHFLKMGDGKETDWGMKVFPLGE